MIRKRGRSLTSAINSLGRLAVLAMILWGVGACGERDQARQDPLRIVISGEPMGFDPHVENEFYAFCVHRHLFEPLVTFDSDLRIQPALARSWDNPDPLTWRFHLRPGVRFHDGSPLTAADVTSSLERARHHPRSELGTYLVAIGGIRVVDPLTVEVKTEHPYAVLLNKLAFVLIVPASAPEEIADPIGTGPYRLAAHQPGERIELEAFADHWSTQPPFQEVHLLVSTGLPDELENVLGAADLIHELAPHDLTPVRAAEGWSVEARSSLDIEYLAMRTDRPPFSDLRVRKALELALDREELLGEWWLGEGRPAAQMVAPGAIGCDPDLVAPRRDVARARRLLDEAGYRDGLEVTLEAIAHGDFEALTRQLGEAGIRLKPKTRTWEELSSRLSAGEVELYLATVVSESADASDILDSMAHTPDPQRGYGAENFAGYSNPSLDRLIEESGTTLDPLNRRRLLQRCMRVLREDLPFVPLYVPNALSAVREELDWRPRLDGTIFAPEIGRR